MDDSYGLFRPEAVAEYKNRLGAPIDANNIATWAFSLFFTSILGVALVLLCTTTYARKENVLGQVTPVAGALRIAAARNGLVSNVLVKEGQHVSARQEVIALSFAPKLGSGNLLPSSLELNASRQQDAQKRQAIAKTSQINHQIAELIARRNGVQADMTHIEHEKKLQEERVKIQEEIVAATHSLGSQGMMPLLTVKAKDDDLIVARQSLASIERNYVDQRNTLDQIGAQLGRLDAELEIVKSDYATQQEQMEEKRLNAEAAYSDHLVAPVNGYVTALQVKPGGPVLANQTLAVVVPDSKDTVANVLEVELWAPSKAIGFIRTGGRVRLMYDAFPYQTFGVGYGSVTEITRAPIMPSEVPIPIDAKEQLFRIRVALDSTELSAYGRRWPLSPGMRVSADLVLEERSLLRWLLDPLLAIRKRSG